MEARSLPVPPVFETGGFYSGPGANPAAAGRMVGTVGRPDNHNLTGRFNEPYATYLHPSHSRMVI